ncbi:SusD/RagB family nutrient-binding outer membrane lipoprotein [Pedobacter punctiformis]|uniref:SusD/RagB family nutrient-binding outer membrane lipoprotein n=1 Tax=Pedobacter punctiformis TaxID=3004097 RepID=A0ABT4LC57_9SPHI|nr:SusD/RagB family nutrient-binding outer membrane lipoprotein [Pedobacter sp. HCMS5-2]MCZ4245456.1 SusD/RagB family nutrient-binding outer membrane lipoprotein [Pedobacter sp. HCMS5-2]
MKNNLKIIGFSMAVAMLFGSCKKNFEEYNTSLSGVNDEVLNADFTKVIGPLREVQKNLINQTNWVYQLQQNLNADVYSGYFMSPTTYGGDNNTNYFMKDGWNDRIMINQLDDVMQKIKNFETGTLVYPSTSFNHTRGFVTILKVIEGHKVSDIHGPVIYTKFGKPNADLSVDFDSQKDAYTAFFADLDAAITGLKATANTGDDKVFTTADIVYGGDVNKWIKLANTLRLRLAIRINYADAAKAKLEGEKALNPANGGLLENNDENAFIKYGSAHPINDIINAWGDCRAGAPIGSILGGYNDPRLASYMLPATDAAVNGQFIGIRNGITLVDNDRYRSYSKPAAKSAAGDYFSSTNGMAKLSCAAETWFLKAEAALNGWAGAGDAQTNYETGVKRSFEEWGQTAASATTYLADNTSTAKPYIDPKAVVAGQNDVLAGSPYLSTITIKWDAAANAEKKLERIITQKWIATYPDGQEAWSEFRRTGYPKLFPVINNASGGTISTTAFIRRLPIPNKFKDSNPGGYQRAVATLGGPDNGGTKLWWDKKP